MVNHYGFYVDSEVPTTGVYSTNSINWEYLDNDICLDCETAYRDIEEIQDCPECEYLLDVDGDCQACGWSKQKEFDYIECDGAHEKLVGDWKRDEEGIYFHDENGEFAGILREFTIQVIWSKTTARGNLCSPCFPGQVDADSTGNFLYFSLPDYLIYKDEKPCEPMDNPEDGAESGWEE